jgi:5'(3')-deoxyribonucleotidase
MKIGHTVYCDMDGVLADFDVGFKQISGGKDPEKTPDSELWSIIKDHGKSEFFRNLPWMAGSKEMWSFITENFLRVKILSATGRSDIEEGGQAALGKTQWLMKNLSTIQEADIIFVPNKHKKRHYSRPGHIIIDDTPVVITEWDAKGGIGILHKSAQTTIGVLRQYV